MANIFKSSTFISNPQDEAQMKAFVEAYWGELENEKMFPIALWKLKRLFAASTTDEAALRITDINFPDEVDGRWLVYDGNYEDALLNDDVQKNENYFVIHESIFDQIREEVPTIYDHIIWGRLGKDSSGKVFAFFNAASCKLITGGTGGEGTGSGIKIPAN